MTSLRCSSLPLYMKCPESLRAGFNVSEWYPESELGSAAHDAAARMVRGQPVDVATIAAVYGVDVDELRMLVDQARRAWRALAPSPDDIPIAEQRLTAYVGGGGLEVELTGTADVLIHHRAPPAVTITIIDWKSGRKDTDYRDQVLGYCALALQTFPRVDLAVAKLIWLRTLEVEAYSLTREDLASWKERIANRERDTAFHPGPHCQYCPRKFTCPGRAAMQKSALAAVSTTPVATERNTIGTLTAEEQITLYKKAKEVSALAGEVVAAVREQIIDHGPIVAAGIKLEMVDEPRRSIRPAQAWPILQEYLTPEALAASVTVHVSKVEDAAGDNQPRGEAGARRKEMFEKLEDAGAISRTTNKKLVERRS